MQTAKQRLDFYFDFADPISYAISTQIGGWAEKSGFEVAWFAIPWEKERPADSQRRARAARALTTAYGYPLFPRFETDSRAACRILAITDFANREQMTMRFFQAWYANDLPPYLDRFLEGLAQDCLVDVDAMWSAVRADQHPADQWIAVEMARGLESGVTSLPSLLLPTGGVISFGDIGEDNAETEVIKRAQAHELDVSISTRPSRCYLLQGEGPTLFCKWCSCDRG